MKSLKNLFFSKKDKKQDKTKMLIQILDRIEKEDPEKGEPLQDLKIDIIENIPLTDKKKAYLKKEIDLFKNGKTNLKQELKKEDLKMKFVIPEFEKTVIACTTSLDTLGQIVKKIEENTDLHYHEIKTANEKKQLEQIKEKNHELQNNLRKIISNLNLTHTEILNHINMAKSVQTKMAILENELDLK